MKWRNAAKCCIRKLYFFWLLYLLLIFCSLPKDIIAVHTILLLLHDVDTLICYIYLCLEYVLCITSCSGPEIIDVMMCNLREWYNCVSIHLYVYVLFRLRGVKICNFFLRFKLPLYLFLTRYKATDLYADCLK